MDPVTVLTRRIRNTAKGNRTFYDDIRALHTHGRTPTELAALSGLSAQTIGRILGTRRIRRATTTGPLTNTRPQRTNP